MAAEGGLDGGSGSAVAALERLYRDLLFPELLGAEDDKDSGFRHICEFALGSLVNEVRSGTVPFFPDGSKVVDKLLAEVGADMPPLLSALVEAGAGFAS